MSIFCSITERSGHGNKCPVDINLAEYVSNFKLSLGVEEGTTFRSSWPYHNQLEVFTLPCLSVRFKTSSVGASLTSLQALSCHEQPVPYVCFIVCINRWLYSGHGAATWHLIIIKDPWSFCGCGIIAVRDVWTFFFICCRLYTEAVEATSFISWLDQAGWWLLMLN